LQAPSNRLGVQIDLAAEGRDGSLLPVDDSSEVLHLLSQARLDLATIVS
jgi:hypothetical protein